MIIIIVHSWFIYVMKTSPPFTKRFRRVLYNDLIQTKCQNRIHTLIYIDTSACVYRLIYIQRARENHVLNNSRLASGPPSWVVLRVGSCVVVVRSRVEHQLPVARDLLHFHLLTLYKNIKYEIYICVCVIINLWTQNSINKYLHIKIQHLVKHETLMHLCAFKLERAFHYCEKKTLYQRTPFLFNNQNRLRYCNTNKLSKMCFTILHIHHQSNIVIW